MDWEEGYAVKKTMIWRHVGRFTVTVHAAADPTPEEWNTQLAAIKRLPSLADVRALVFSEGGGPNAKQRQALSAILEGTRIPIALMTSSNLAKAMGGLLGWAHPHFCVFDVLELDAALKHLNASALERPIVTQTLAELRALLHVEER